MSPGDLVIRRRLPPTEGPDQPKEEAARVGLPVHEQRDPMRASRRVGGASGGSDEIRTLTQERHGVYRAGGSD